MAFPFTPDRDWSNVPEGETAPPGAPVADDAWFEAVEDALHEHDAHQDAVYAVHGGLVGYVADSDDPPTAPPNGLMWFRPDTDERLINTGTSGTPVWDQLADDMYKLTTADLVSDYVISGLLPSVPTPTSLAPTVPSGAAYIIGKRVVKASGAHTVPARKATLVDLSDQGVYSNVDYGILLDDTEDVWNEKTDADFTVSVVAGPTDLGNAVRFVIASGASAGDSVSEAIPVADLSGYGKIAVWMRSSVTTTSGQLQFLLDNTASVASPVHTLNVPALTANTWTLCEMAYTSTTGTDAIISIGLKYTTDIGAANVDICKPFALKASVPAVSADSIRLFEARASADIQQVNTVTVTSAVNSTIYTVTINGVDNTYTSDASATTAEIAAGLAAAINASVDVLVTPVTATYVSGATFTVSADVPGVGFTVAVGTNLSQASTVANSSATVLSIADMRDLTPTLDGVAGVTPVAEDIEFTPVGSIGATDVQAAIEEVAAEAGSGGAASSITFTPAGSIGATDVQAAIEEVASEAGSGGGSGNADVPVINITDLATAGIWTNMPSALTEWMGSSAVRWSRAKVDLTDAVEARISVTMAGVAGVAGAEVRCQYSTDNGSSWNYLDHSAGPAVSIATGSATTAGSWVTLNASAKADVLLRVIGINGNGTADPNFEGLQVQVRYGTSGGGASSAAGITFTPTGTIASTDVQAAIAEVAAEAGGTGYKTLVTLGSDVATTNNAAWSDVTGLSFSVTSGVTYRFHALIIFDTAATTTGGAFSINGPAATFVGFRMHYPTTGSGDGIWHRNAYDGSLASVLTATANTTTNIAFIEGVVKPSSSGTLIVRSVTEISGSAITVKAGSTLEWW